MARLLTRGFVVLGALHLLVACPQFSPDAYESLEPVNDSCRALCCFEFESPCATWATYACQGCDDRCRGACADGGPLLRCMQQSSATFQCPSPDIVEPPAGVCRAEFDTYQAGVYGCTLGQGTVGASRPGH